MMMVRLRGFRWAMVARQPRPHEDRTVSFERNHAAFGLRQRDAKRNRARQAHAAKHVKILRQSKLLLPIPPTTASSCLSLRIRNSVSAVRLSVLTALRSSLTTVLLNLQFGLGRRIAAGQQRRKDKRDRRLRRIGLLDR